MSAPLRQRDWGGALFGSLWHYRRSWLAGDAVAELTAALAVTTGVVALPFGVGLVTRGAGDRGVLDARRGLTAQAGGGGSANAVTAASTVE